jgi:hypothetical protein
MRYFGKRCDWLALERTDSFSQRRRSGQPRVSITPERYETQVMNMGEYVLSLQADGVGALLKLNSAYFRPAKVAIQPASSRLAKGLVSDHFVVPSCEVILRKKRSKSVNKMVMLRTLQHHPFKNKSLATSRSNYAKLPIARFRCLCGKGT